MSHFKNVLFSALPSRFLFQLFHSYFLPYLLLYFSFLLRSFFTFISLSQQLNAHTWTSCPPLCSDYAGSSLGVARTLMRSRYRSPEPPQPTLHCRQAEETWRATTIATLLYRHSSFSFLCIFMPYHWLP
jgi:hypothetical protein